MQERRGPNQNYRKTFIPKPEWNDGGPAESDGGARSGSASNQYYDQYQ